jgi:cellulose synthase/poly-beta-1,6-N-acetylglucosamine synthase-like glycosyltransferase
MQAGAPSSRRITMGRLALVLTVLAWIAYIVTTILREFVDHGIHGMRFVTEAVSYAVVVTFLTFSSLMYLLARQGYLYRAATHRRTARAEIDRSFNNSLPSMTVLVPSYREDPRIVRKTLLSAALQEYPYLRVVLLLDDPPNPTDRDAIEQLEAGRQISNEVAAFLAEPRNRFTAAMDDFESRSRIDEDPSAEDARTLADHYDWAVTWLRDAAEAEPLTDHVDVFFVEQVLGALADDLEIIRDALLAAADEGACPSSDRLLELYRRLAWTFRAELATFERKRYASLSAEPNKAMNLNSYIGLMGSSYTEEHTPDGILLRPARNAGSLVIPDSDYVLTLDADSVLLREYCLRLVHQMELPENARVAVIQTPYSAFPGSATRLERLAGATTDLQHILHQGMTYYGATFWVGANAVLRKHALEDIEEVDSSNGFRICRYIQDRTVIEDTESSIDLGIHGWKLVNYPERLSYSATPADFGSLCIQRRRWADGGLLILPKLWRQARQRRRSNQRGRLGELLLRINYMASICWSSLGLVFLLAYPYDSRLLSPLVLLAAAPYFLAMASDLKKNGYKRTDVLRIYAFNLILLPVNLAGVFKSLQQAMTNQKIPFARTPKVKDRTTAPLLFVVMPYAIVAFSLYTLWRDYHAANWGNAAFAAFNTVATLYAIVAYIGVRNSIVDVFVNIIQRLYVPVRPRRNRQAKQATANVAQTQPQLDWESTLYLGVAAQREGREARRIRRTIVLPEIGADIVDAAVSEETAPAAPAHSGALAQSGDDMPPAAAALLDFVRSVNGGKVGGVELRVDDPKRLTVTVDLTD